MVSLGDPVNASNNITDEISISIIDDDLPQLVSFELSSDEIEENSLDDVILTASVDYISGKDISIPFTMSGSAEIDTEYEVSANSITIPAGSKSGTVEISTYELDDFDVEGKESIIFNFTDLVNARTEIESITLYLISDDSPKINSLSIDKSEMAEHESALITATPKEHSKNVEITFNVSGTATFDIDYKVERDLNESISLKLMSGNWMKIHRHGTTQELKIIKELL